ncbi:MAG: hypothetical protein U0790_27850 [Isosphaeraceae bacterium]
MIVSSLFEQAWLAILRIVKDERGVKRVTTRGVMVGMSDPPRGARDAVE